MPVLPSAPHLRLCPPPALETVAEHIAPPDAKLPPSPSPLGNDAPLSLDRLFVDYAQYVAQVALRVLGRDEEVDDVVQEVFLCACQGLAKLRHPQAIRGWLKTITVRKAYRLLRRRRLRAWLGLNDEATHGHHCALEVPSSGCTPEERALLTRIYRLLDELPADERLAWTLRYLDGEQIEAVASLCGCSLATAKRRISAAHTFLERMLRDD